jgi:hypothetical protein
MSKENTKAEREKQKNAHAESQLSKTLESVMENNLTMAWIVYSRCNTIFVRKICAYFMSLRLLNAFFIFWTALTQNMACVNVFSVCPDDAKRNGDYICLSISFTYPLNRRLNTSLAPSSM